MLYLSSQLVAGGSVQSLPHSFISHGFQYEIHVGGAAPRHSRHGVLRESLNSILHTQLSSCLTYLGLLDPPAEAHAGEETGHQVAVPAIRPRAQAVDRGSLPCQEDSQDDVRPELWRDILTTNYLSPRALFFPIGGGPEIAP